MACAHGRMMNHKATRPSHPAQARASQRTLWQCPLYLASCMRPLKRAKYFGMVVVAHVMETDNVTWLPGRLVSAQVSSTGELQVSRHLWAAGAHSS
jgi:hypothetical protein